MFPLGSSWQPPQFLGEFWKFHTGSKLFYKNAIGDIRDQFRICTPSLTPTPHRAMPICTNHFSKRGFPHMHVPFLGTREWNFLSFLSWCSPTWASSDHLECGNVTRTPVKYARNSNNRHRHKKNWTEIFWEKLLVGNNHSCATDWCCKGHGRHFSAWRWKVTRVKKSSWNFHAWLKNWIAQNRASVAAGTRKGFSGLLMILCNSNNSALSSEILCAFWIKIIVKHGRTSFSRRGGNVR